MRDGNIREGDIDDETPELFFSSLLTSGLHRTQNELEDRRVVELTAFGSQLRFGSKNGHVSINQMSHLFDQPVVRNTDTYSQFRFNGTNLHNGSIDYSYRYRNINLFGESAMSSNGGQAHLVGALIGLDRRLNFALLYRNYGIDYHSIGSNAFGEGSTVENENGVYMGLEFLINKNWTIRTYADMWNNPWLRFQVGKPAGGTEYNVRVDYRIKRKLSAYVQYFQERKSIDLLTEGQKINSPQVRDKKKIRFHFSNVVSKGLEFRTRLEFTHINHGNTSSTGTLLYQDVLFKPLGKPYSFTTRFALFDVDDFDSRVFSYENSILYEFSIPSYFGQGFRYYINYRHKLGRRLTGELRWARTYKLNDTHGSGQEFIDGDTKTDIKAQLKISF